MRQNWPGNVRQLENAIERAILYSADEPVIKLENFSFDTDHLKISDNNIGDALLTISEMEKRMIYNSLRKTNGNRTQAARILGISVRTLRNKLHEYEKENGSLPEDIKN